MTDIPGTGKIKSDEEGRQVIPVIPINVVNIKELKRGDKSVVENNSVWYHKLQFWLIIGIVFSLIFLILSLKYKSFLVFIPVGPVTALISWYIRGVLKKYEPKPKRYSS
jgi:hypothetical protein